MRSKLLFSINKLILNKHFDFFIICCGEKIMPFFVEKGDLVSKNVDAIVNASNVNLSMVEGVGRAIYHKAGDTELAKACKAIGHCNVGDAVITPSFGLTNAKAIFHAVGPIYINGKHDEEKNLRSVYQKCFKMMKENNFTSIAFPLLSGEFNYPLKECYQIAKDEILKFVHENPEDNIYIVMFKNFPEMVSDETQIKLTKYIIDNQSRNFSNQKIKSSFHALLKEYVDRAGLSTEELAYRSNMKVSHLLKIIDRKDDVDIHKDIIISLAIGLSLNIEEMNGLLISKGFVIEPSLVNDLIVCYFLNCEDFDIYKANDVLFKYGNHPLGCEF